MAAGVPTSRARGAASARLAVVVAAVVTAVVTAVVATVLTAPFLAQPGWAAVPDGPPGGSAGRASTEGLDTLDAPVLFLVRHAEKAEQPAGDPSLTAEGTARAAALAGLLADAGLDAVWSTDYARTRTTAAPVAGAEGLEVELYDPRDLATFADSLRARGGRALVVGHSNTTPALVQALGGDPGLPIDEATEYDRLYILTLTPDGPVTTVLRFGRPSRDN